jgi:hypothetical protein
MSLRSQAESDLAIVLENSADFGWPVVFTDPDGVSNVDPIYCASGDIGTTIDPNTGVPVSGRSAYLSVRRSTLTAAGLDMPTNVESKTSKPWRATFVDINGHAFTYKIISSMPDRTIGLITCELSIYDS